MTHSCLDNFIRYDDQHHRLMMEGVYLSTMVQQHGTPLYCYSAASIGHAIAQYKSAFESCPLPVTIHYAAKANSRLAILQVIKDCKLGLDIVSVGEMMAGMRAGFSPQDIIYSGVGKTNDDIAFAINNNIGQLNIESFDEIEMVIKAATTIKPKKPIAVAMRVTPDISAGGHSKISTGKAGDKFGIAFDEALAAYKLLLACPYLSPTAIAMHIGSQLTDMAAVEKAYRQLAELIIQLHQQGIALGTADIGGGMAITYNNETPLPLPDYAAMVSTVFSPLKTSTSLKKISIEPGRSIVGRAGVLLCRVILQKQSGGKHITVVDAAMNDLIRPTLYHAYHGILPLVQADPAIDMVPQDVVGGICETGDFLALARKLPKVSNGDTLAVFQAGAYGSVMTSNYNSRLLPAEILISGREHYLIRARQTFNDFFCFRKKHCNIIGRTKHKMKKNTAFDDLGKRANRFSRPVASFFVLLGMGALFLGYWFQNNFQQAPEVASISTADVTSFDAAASGTTDNINNPANSLIGKLANTDKTSKPSNAPDATKKTTAVATTTDAASLTAANINKNDMYGFIQKDTFGKALIRGGVSPAEAYIATQQARKIFPLSSLGENQVVKLDFGKTATNQRFLKQFSVRVGDASELLVRRLDNGTFEASLNQLAVDNSVKLYRFKIDKTGSLATSAEAAGLSQENIQNMVDLLSLDINLQTDIRDGDLMQLMFDESSTAQKDEIGGNLRVVLMASPKTGADNAFFYFIDESGSAGYYNSDGKSQRKMLLATPVDGARITSGFGNRFHPVLGFTRAHKGIDFSAPIGTKVKASGDGVIEVLRWESGYGNYLKIRHRDGYSTAYAHLRGYEKGLAVGSKVKQGQIVAYVGNTGISTGPHLHYEILISNDHVNPSTVKLPALRALAGTDLSKFELVKKDALLRIQNAQIMVKQ